MLSPHLQRLLRDKLRRSAVTAQGEDTPRPKYGEEIFVDSGPRTFDAYVGQSQAIRQLRATIGASKAMGNRLPHIALSSGTAGLGKTALARLIAAEMGVGISEVSGKLDVKTIRPVLLGMADHDVLFIDEAHLLMGAKGGTEGWLLSLMEGGHIQTDRREPMPDITVVAATTEFGKLPKAWQSRFMVRPVLLPYTESEGLALARSHAAREGFGTELLPMPEEKVLSIVAAAANNTPRSMKPVLIALRDSFLGEGSGDYDIDLALSWVGLERDGLDTLAVDYLLALVALDGTGSQESIQGMLDEPGSLRGTEQLLQQRGYLRIESRGRQITESGTDRAEQLAAARGLL